MWGCRVSRVGRVGGIGWVEGVEGGGSGGRRLVWRSSAHGGLPLTQFTIRFHSFSFIYPALSLLGDKCRGQFSAFVRSGSVDGELFLVQFGCCASAFD